MVAFLFCGILLFYIVLRLSKENSFTPFYGDSKCSDFNLILKVNSNIQEIFDLLHYLRMIECNPLYLRLLMASHNTTETSKI